jgi:NADH:ubiquinone oxidoreductase subunit
MVGGTFGTWLYTKLKGELVGQDAQGNRYYRQKGGGNVHDDSLRKERRWVYYNGEIEASRVPSEWHGWLHHGSNEVPREGGPAKYAWQKEHLPNRTGTDQAYRPPGHAFKGGTRDKATGDYEPWKPG